MLYYMCMVRINVGVLRGGPSDEYEVSLSSGAFVLNNAPEETCQTHDIFISKDGQWHRHGIPANPEQALHGIDVVFNALHGRYGEDGEVQKILDTHAIPYTGSGVFASALSMNKEKTNKVCSEISGIKVPAYCVVYASEAAESPMNAAKTVFNQFGPRYIVKPLNNGSALGIDTADTLYELADILEGIFEYVDAVIVQQYIQGTEVSCGAIQNFRDADIYTLPPVEITYSDNENLWRYRERYDEPSEKRCPSNIMDTHKKTIEDATRAIHETLGLGHYSRADFIISPSGVYFLEANSSPKLSEHAIIPTALTSVGVSHSDYLDHVLQLALSKK